jgi:hypothetical protein
MISTVRKAERRAMRRLMVAVIAAVALGGCGHASEDGPPTSIEQQAPEVGTWEGGTGEQQQQLEDEFERQMAEDAGVDPSATSTTLSPHEMLCAESPDC